MEISIRHIVFSALFLFGTSLAQAATPTKPLTPKEDWGRVLELLPNEVLAPAGGNIVADKDGLAESSQAVAASEWQAIDGTSLADVLEARIQCLRSSVETVRLRAEDAWAPDESDFEDPIESDDGRSIGMAIGTGFLVLRRTSVDEVEAVVSYPPYRLLLWNLSESRDPNGRMTFATFAARAAFDTVATNAAASQRRAIIALLERQFLHPHYEDLAYEGGRFREMGALERVGAKAGLLLRGKDPSLVDEKMIITCKKPRDIGTFLREYVPETAQNHYDDGKIVSKDDPEFVIERRSLFPNGSPSLERRYPSTFWMDNNLAKLFANAADSSTNELRAALERVADQLVLKPLEKEAVRDVLVLSPTGDPPLGPRLIKDGSGFVHAVGFGAAIVSKDGLFAKQDAKKRAESIAKEFAAAMRPVLRTRLITFRFHPEKGVFEAASDRRSAEKTPDGSDARFQEIDTVEAVDSKTGTIYILCAAELCP